MALLTQGYSSGTEYFVSVLAEGIGTIAAAFYPNDVILRFSDFKTNEYANLLGGQHFEPKEENPMLGWRGASRYYDERYSDGFALECAAVKKVRGRSVRGSRSVSKQISYAVNDKVREVFGLTNLITMIPFCRTVAEAERVLATMAKNGLKRGENGLKVCK